MGLENKWGVLVGNIVAVGILGAAVLFAIALMLLGLGAVVTTWRYFMEA